MKKLLPLIVLSVLIFTCEDHETLTENQIELDQSKSSVSLKTTSTNGNLPMILPNNFIWGINGHPVTQAAYIDNGSIIDMQIDLINEHLFSYYRVDIGTNSTGDSISPSFRQSKFDELIENLPNNNIKLLPVLKFSSFDFELTEEELYERAKIQATGFIEEYGTYFEYIAIGNEEELRCTDEDSQGNCLSQILQKDASGNDQSGNLLSHYNQPYLKKVAAYLKGLSDGIGSSKKIIINNGGAKHYGFQEFMDTYTLDGINGTIRYDIAGVHWYDLNQAIVQLSDNNNYTKPVWITESNRKNGSYSNEENSQADTVNDMINKLDGSTNIQAFFLYELYDEPAFVTNLPETQYGIVKWETRYSDFNYKPVSEVIKFKIEESTFGFEDYVYLFYERVNLGQPDVNGLNYWTNLLAGNRNKLGFLNSILPEKSYELFVKKQYDSLLDRSADSGGLNYWIDRMKSGFTRENLILEFCIGSEFWNKSGQNNDGFIQRIYLKLLGKLADPEGFAFWTGELNNGESKISVVDRIMKEEDYLSVFINSQYNILYQREGDNLGIDYWTNRMKNGLNQQDLIIEFLLSEEFWEKSIIEGYERKNLYPFSHN